MQYVKVGEKTYILEGNKPFLGSQLNGNFSIPEAFGSGQISAAELSMGLTIVSTLPDVHKEHCIQQILELEGMTYSLLPSSTKIYHFSYDAKEVWQAASQQFQGLEIRAYTLHDIDSDNARAFKNSFGVGVEGTGRIAHGLFALMHGQFVTCQIPDDQLGVPNIPLFLKELLDVQFIK